MILSSLPAHNVGHKTLISHGSTDRGQATDHSASDRRYLTTVGISAYTTTGVIGYPSRATEAKGHALLNHLGRNADTLVTLLTEAARPEECQ